MTTYLLKLSGCLLVLGSIRLPGCQQPAMSAERKLLLQLEAEKKVANILRDLHADCDSATARTIRYRTDSLFAARQQPTPPPTPAKKIQKKSAGKRRHK